MTDTVQRVQNMRAPIEDKDIVFARLKGNKPASANRCETLTIPGRAGASGSRLVQVLHLRSGGTIHDRPRRIGGQAGTVAWRGILAAR